MRDINLGKTSCPTSTLVCEACTEDEQYEAKLGNAVDMLATKFKVFLMENGIQSAPQDIGLVECANQTVIAMIKRMPKFKNSRNYFGQK